MAMKEVELCRIVHSDQTPECQMYLREKESGRVFPIIIHHNEMAEIHRKLHGVVMERPMTHDLFARLMQAAGLHLASVEVTKLEKDIFYARMNFEGGDGRSFSLDARPSDAVAIATGVHAPLYASDDIVRSIGVAEDEQDGG
jgi:hypothetical protein